MSKEINQAEPMYMNIRPPNYRSAGASGINPLGGPNIPGHALLYLFHSVLCQNNCSCFASSEVKIWSTKMADFYI